MKRVVYIFLLTILFSMRINALDLYSKQAILYDPKTKEILLEKNSEDIASIASLTKIMTTIVAIENIDDLNEYVTITYDMLKDIPSDASVAGLKVGDKVTYLDLLYASILPSGADATTVLAHSLSGSTEEFVKLMNMKAKELGLNNTRFSNVTGYDISNHYSTPKEILDLLLYSLDNELFKKIYTTNEYTLSNGLTVQSTINKYNKLLGYDTSSIIGSKTGYTYDAGLCISAIIKTNDKELLLVTLGADYTSKIPYNLVDTLNIIDYMNNNYSTQVLYKKGDILLNIPVLNSNIDSYNIVVNKDITKYIKKDYDKKDVTFKYTGLDTLSYKNKYNEKIGHVKYFYKDKIIYEEDMFLNKEIKFSFKKYFLTNIIYFISSFIILTLIIIFIIVKKMSFQRK